MSRCVSLNHAFANASANSCGFLWKRREIFSYAGSNRSARSVVSIDGAIFFDCVVGVRDRPFTGAVLRLPLLRTSRARGQLPFVLEEVLEEVVAPLRRRRGPGDLETARDGVGSLAGFVAALPAETLLLEVAALGFGTDVGRRARAVGLAERVAAGDERHRLLVVHRHAPEGLANVSRGGDGIGLAVRPFGIHVDEAHLHGAERIRQLPVAAVALVAEPRGLGSPVDVLGLPAHPRARRRSRTS